MAVLNSRSRGEIRRSVGFNLGAMRVGQTTDSGNASEVFDNLNFVFGGTNDGRGKWVLMSDSGDSNAGEFRRVLSADPDGNQYTVVPFSNNVADAANFEVWDADMPPDRINDFINRAIESATRKGVVPALDTSQHFGGGLRAFDLPSTMVAVEKVEYRRVVNSKVVSNCDAVFTAAANVTASTDGEDKRSGGGSAKLEIAAGFTTGEVANDSFSGVDLRGYTHLEFWAKSNIATSSGTFDLFLNDSATEQLSIPALAADEWTFNQVALTAPESDSGITEVVIQADSDPGASTLWLDDIRAIRAGTEQWEAIHPAFWDIDRVNRQVVFKPEFTLPYGLIRITGYRKPSLLTTDSASSDIDAEYIINKATALALDSRSDRKGARRDAAAMSAEKFERNAEIARLRLQAPRQARWVD